MQKIITLLLIFFFSLQSLSSQNCASLLNFDLSKKILTEEESLNIEVYASAVFATKRDLATDIMGVRSLSMPFDETMNYIDRIPERRKQELVSVIYEGLLRQRQGGKDVLEKDMLPRAEFITAFDKLYEKGLLRSFITDDLLAILVNGSMMSSKINWRAYGRAIKELNNVPPSLILGSAVSFNAPYIASRSLVENLVWFSATIIGLGVVTPVLTMMISPKKSGKLVRPVFIDRDASLNQQQYIFRLGEFKRALYNLD